MVTTNILRYGLDEAVLDRRGMIRTRDGSELDCSGATSVEGIEVGGSEPHGTKRRVAFRVGGAWGVLEPSGTPGTALFVPFLEQGISANSVIDEGNTADELQAFSSVPDFAGKKVGLAVALCAKLDASEMPTLSLALKCRNVNDTFVKVLTSPELDFGTASEISSARVDQASSNGGSVSVKARLTLQDGHRLAERFGDRGPGGAKGAVPGHPPGGDDRDLRRCPKLGPDGVHPRRGRHLR